MKEKPLYTIGVDLGGTHVRVCAFENNNPKLLSLIKEPSSISDSPEEVLYHIDEMITALMKHMDITFEDIENIGISIPDAIDPEDGIIYAPSTLISWKGMPIRDYFIQKYPVSVYVENDANMAALGEYRFGTGQGSRDMVYLTLSTGVGAGIICDGKLYRGADGLAGEVGQFIVDKNGPICPNCKRKGCIDVMGSGTGVALLAQKFLSEGKKIGNFTKETDAAITAEDVVGEARKGDVVAQEILEKTARVIAQVIQTIIFTLNPDTIVVGGGFSAAFDLLFPTIDDYLTQHLSSFVKDSVKIVKNDLGGEAGLLGALAIQSKRRNYTLKGVILDLDGVTIFSEDAHRNAFDRVIQKHFGRVLNQDDYHFYFMGKTDAQGFLAYLQSLHETKYSLNTLLHDKEEAFLDHYVQEVKGNEAIIALIHQLAKEGIPVGIATSSSREDLEKALQQFRLQNDITVALSADEVTHWKPSPEPYIITASRLKVLPDECLVIEDSPAGIKAAKDAGAVCVALTTTHAAAQLSDADSVTNTITFEDILHIMKRKKRENNE